MAQEYKGVDTEHPQLVNFIKSAKKLGKSKEEAAKLAGVPYEVVDKHYQNKDR